MGLQLARQVRQQGPAEDLQGGLLYMHECVPHTASNTKMLVCTSFL